MTRMERRGYVVISIDRPCAFAPLRDIVKSPHRIEEPHYGRHWGCTFEPKYFSLTRGGRAGGSSTVATVLNHCH